MAERRDASVAAMRDALVEQRQRVAHGAFGDAGDQRQRLGLRGDAFGGADPAQVRDHRARLDAPQIEANAARAHGDRHLVDLGGREQELDVLGRLFERLQEAVEGLLREHVHFVDDIDLGARRNRAVARVLDDLAHVVDAGVGGRVHLDHVDMAQFHDRLAMDAEFGHVDACALDPAGQRIIEGARQNARGCRLADAAHAGEDIGLVDAARGEGIGERAHHRLLADEVLEAHRPVFSRQHPIGGVGLRCCGVGEREERIAQQRPLIGGKGGGVSQGSLDRSPAREGEPASGSLALAAQARQWEVGQRPALSR